MAPPFDPQLLKGVLTLLLLHMLGEEESYGYEVVQRLRSIGLEDVAAGTVYPALSRLEKDGLLIATLVASTEGPARKYYRPTPAGRRALADGVEQWRSLARIVDTQLVVPNRMEKGSRT